jgi:FkbM family methyltransferase
MSEEQMKEFIRQGLHSLGLEMYRYPDACERVEPHLKVLLRRHPVDLMIDVGANVGQFGREIRALNPGVPLYSFEPNPPVFQELQALAASDPLWRTFNVALGAEEGEITLNVTASDDFSSVLAPNALGQELYRQSVRSAGQVQVRMRRLDDVFREAGGDQRNILFKMDTQGYDKQVMLGGTEVLRRSAIVLTECSIQPIYEAGLAFIDALNFMTDAGFVLSGCFPLGRDARGALIEVNCAFVRA